MAATTKLDVIIFGASGFTGKYTVFEAVTILSDLTWAIAGRNKSKLDETLKETGEKSGKDLSKIPVIIADVDDAKSLKEMAHQCKVVVNCCGPYQFYGEQVVKACLDAGTHHVDVSGEPQYMETMQLKYNTEAQKKGVYIISACGFDSILADLGIVYTENEFDGVLNSVETYFVPEAKQTPDGAIIHYGTWASAVNEFPNMHKMKDIRKKLYETKLPKFGPKLKNRFVVHKREFVAGYCIPFHLTDQSVVTRSQRFFYDRYKKRPIQMRAYVQLSDIHSLAVIALVGLIFVTLNQFIFGRKLLLNHPQILSLGAVSHAGPTEECMKNADFKIMISGSGWSKDVKFCQATDTFQQPPNKHILTQVCGTNPAYGATCVALLLSATTVIKESDKMPDKGGVLPPAAAFAKTSLISELCKNGIKFDVVAKSK